MKHLIWLCSAMVLAAPAALLAKESSPGKPSAAALAELGLEQLVKLDINSVKGASRYEQKTSEAPSAVTIITANDIARYGYRTMVDILKSVRGFYVTDDRSYSYIGARGFGRPGDYNCRVLFLVDGHRINDAVYGGVNVGNEFIVDVDLIDRVEIVRGPTSSLYGMGAFFGMVNIVTKTGKDYKLGEAAGSFGDLRTNKGRLTYGHKFASGVEAMASGSLYNSEGRARLYFPEFNDPVNNPLSANEGYADHLDREWSGNTFAKLRLNDFTFEAATVRRDKAVPTAAYKSLFNTPGFDYIDESSFLDLRYEHSHKKLKLDVMARLFMDNYRFRGTYPMDDGAGGMFLNEDTSEGKSWGSEAQVAHRFGKNNRIMVGWEYQNTPHQDQMNFDVDPYFLYTDSRVNSYFWGTWLSTDLDIFKHLRFSGALRYDFFSRFGSTTNPRLALIYTPSRRSVIKAMYGTAFRCPNVYEHDYYGVGYATGTVIKPETITTTELVWEQEVNKKVSTTVSGYTYRMNDLIQLHGDPDLGIPFYFQNESLIKASGLEFEVRAKLPRGLEGRASYTAQKTNVPETGLELTNSPQKMAKLNLIAPFDDGKWNLGLEQQYMSTRITEKGNICDSHFVTNVTLSSSKLVKSMDLSASLYNLFDERYYDPMSTELTQDQLQQNGRACRFKAVARF